MPRMPDPFHVNLSGEHNANFWARTPKYMFRNLDHATLPATYTLQAPPNCTCFSRARKHDLQFCMRSLFMILLCNFTT